MTALTSQPYVEAALLRPLTDAEEEFVVQPDNGLIDQASALLRQRAPYIDDRIARFNADPTDPTAVAPVVVASVLAGVIKRYLVNPTGIASKSDTMGPFSHSEAYALRWEKDRRGALEVTDEDLAALFPSRRRLRAGTIRTRAAMAPRPVGRYGMIPSLQEAAGAALTFGGDPVLDAEQAIIRGGNS